MVCSLNVGLRPAPQGDTDRQVQIVLGNNLARRPCEAIQPQRQNGCRPLEELHARSGS